MKLFTWSSGNNAEYFNHFVECLNLVIYIAFFLRAGTVKFFPTLLRSLSYRPPLDVFTKCGIRSFWIPERGTYFLFPCGQKKTTPQEINSLEAFNLKKLINERWKTELLGHFKIKYSFPKASLEFEKKEEILYCNRFRVLTVNIQFSLI